jgi:hypothetical protein
MKKILLTAAGLMALLHGYSQVSRDSSGYQPRKLKIDEINLVSSYYKQDGENAAVTGGIGSQKLTDIANVLEVKLTRYDKRFRKHSYGIEVGIDHYTSASSDKIDMKANSSASYQDTRIYPSLSWSVENEKKGTTFGVGLSSSAEYDYLSFGGNISFAKKTKDRSGEFSAKLQAYIDQVNLIAPEELRGSGDGSVKSGGSEARNTFVASLSYSQVINERLQVVFLADGVQQQGFLSLPFYRVYFNDGSVHQEKLPDSRFKIPLGFRANYFLGDKFIVRTYYRFYTDDWGLQSHTASLEVPVKITPFISVSPFYRYYNQTAVKYFSGYAQHTAADEFYTSNYDLSKFSSNFVGAGIRFSPPRGVLGIEHFKSMEIRYGHYSKSIPMNADIISLHLQFK